MHVEVLHSHMTLSQVTDKVKCDTLTSLLQMRIFLNKDFIYIHKTHKQDLFSVEPSQFSHRKKIYKIKNNEMQPCSCP